MKKQHRQQKQETGSSPPRLNSVSRNNNSWYAVEPGESAKVLNSGEIKGNRPWNRPAWEKSDNYSKSRNAAMDNERYSYMTDCTDVLHRDYPLRFSRSPAPKDGYTVLPELKFCKGKMDSVVPSVYQAKSTVLKGVAAPSRFEIRAPPGK
jgi:hypothetical protein